MTSYPNVKLNLGLRILRKRPDGYHDLETLFIPYFGMTDILEITPSEVESIKIDGASWDPHSDLCWKAWQLMKSEFGLPPVSISLIKRNPVGAGLGGGSSDAAFTIRMLNELFSLDLNESRMAGYASRLGSDCAFFIYNRPMFGEGRGEQLSPFDIDLSPFDIRIAVPEGVSVSTKEAYAGVVPYENSGESLKDILRLDVGEWRGRLVNDFEPSVFRVHPQIETIKRRFYEDGALYASMSGSGSSVFALFRK